MLKKLMVTLVLTLFTTALTFAQPVLTRDLVYQLGTRVEVKAADMTGIDPGPPGANQTWDLSGVTRGPADSDFVLEWIDPSEAPAIGSYPDANLVEKQTSSTGDSYLFYQDTGSQLLLIGLDVVNPDGPIEGPYSDPAVQFQYPTSFNGSWSDDWAGTLLITTQGFQVESDRTGSQTIKYDGYGTVITPTGTFDNVIRIQAFQDIRDEYSIMGIDAVLTFELENYTWLQEGTPYPLINYTTGRTKLTTNGATIFDMEVENGTWLDVEGSGGGNNGGGNNGGGDASGRYGSHVTVQGGSFETSLLVTNTSGTAQTVDIQPISSSGVELTPIPIAAAGSSAQRVSQASIFSADVSHFTVSGSDDVKVSVGYRAATGGADAPVHEAPPIEGNFYLYPGEPDLLFDGVALVNAGSAPATINATWLNETGGVMGSETIVADLAVGAKQLALFDQLFPNLDGTGIIRIEPSEPVGAMILRGSRDGQYLYQNLPVQAASGDRWIPHLTAVGGNFTTDVFLHNASSTPQSATLMPFSASGAPQPNMPLVVPGNGFLRVEQTQLSANGYSHFRLDAPTEVTASVGYRAAVSGASTAQVHETTPINRTFYLYPGDWDLVYDAVAIVNTGSSNATVTATQIGVTGPKGEAVTLVDGLAPNAKSLLVLGTVFNGESSEAIRIDTTQPLALLVLRGSLDGRYLYLNPPIPD